MKKKLILGTVQFGLKYGINNSNGKPKKSDVFKILSYAHENGIKYLDTAESYGNAHDLIGEFHKLNPTKKFQIITKFPHDFENSLEENINIYLTQLNVDYLNTIMFHSFESYIKNKEQLENIIKHKNKNFKNIGVSVYSNDQIDEIIDNINVDIIQLPFNLFDNMNLRGELLKKAKEQNKIIHTRSAFLQGLFFMKKDNPNSIRIKFEKELNLIEAISLESRYAIGSIALNYCLLQHNIDGVLIGVDTIEQLKENLSFLENDIKEEFLTKINSVKIDNIELLNPSRWK
jgi:aryl-alcohol dehydrogenase-like predicted oxidoreductase